MSSRPKRSAVERSAVPSWKCFSTEESWAFGPTQGDEKRLLFSNYSAWKDRPPLCHLDRSEAQWRDLRSLLGNVFRQRSRGPSGPPKVMKNGSCSVTTLPGRTALPFVISTEAKRSGEICGPFLEMFFRQRSHGPSGPPKVMKNGSCSATTLPGRTALPFVISTEAKRSGEICGSAVPSWECFSTEPRGVDLRFLPIPVLAMSSASFRIGNK